MIATLLFVAFLGLMFVGVPIGAALGLAGAAAIALANADSQWFGLLAVPQNFYAGLGKYPLLAIPMFVLVGSIFDRSGVALRLVNFAVAMVGRGPGMLPLVAIAVAMFLGGISGSGPANAAAVGGVMIAAMSRAGYPPSFSASVVGAAAATDILIPPSVAFIIYSVLVPGASVPALFAAGMVPGVLAGVALILPIFGGVSVYGGASVLGVPFALAMLGAALLLLGTVFLLVQIAVSIRQRRQLTVLLGDPWDGRSLEWSIPSPPPPWNFSVIPHVDGRDAFTEAKKTGQAYRSPAAYSDIEVPRNSMAAPLIGAFSFDGATCSGW